MRPRGRAPAASGCTRPAATCSRTCWRCRRRTCARRRWRWRVRGGALERLDADHVADAHDAAPRARGGPRVAAPAVRAAPGDRARAAAEAARRERGAGRARGRADRRARAGARARSSLRTSPRTPSRSRARRSRTSCTAPRCGAASRSRPERVFVPLALPAPGARDAALDELARRYSACHAGATADDLAYWSGLPARDVRAPADTPSDDGPVPRVAAPGLRRAPARLARPHADRPGGVREAGPSGRRDPARGDPRGRRRRGHVERAR